eukprot:c12718_g1_i2.p1 GENE.c12718_g1_i2~~c12718_g1_i2.p1  ORF type:complete len:412 (+),score=90.58 c12718_g1_i2:128-1237(+)
MQFPPIHELEAFLRNTHGHDHQNLTELLVSSSLHESIRTQVAIRRLLANPRLASLTDDQKAVFVLGYGAGIEEGGILVGAIIMAVLCGVCTTLPMLHIPLRQWVRPWARRHVQSGHNWVLMIQKHNHPYLDMVHQLVSLSCSVEFYLVFLPLVFWSGYSNLGRPLVNLMSLANYVGNVCKDLICSERPNWKQGIRLVGYHKEAVEGLGVDDEYGIPSSHTINTICLLGYMLHFYNYHGPGNARWFHQSVVDTNMGWYTLVAVLWTVVVIHGRLYLGMHSPIDIFGALIAAFLVLAFYIALDDFIDSWETTYRFTPHLQLAISVLQIFAHPTPDRYTPTYSYSVYFIGVVLGVIIGVWRRPDLHSNEECS